MFFKTTFKRNEKGQTKFEGTKVIKHSKLNEKKCGNFIINIIGGCSKTKKLLDDDRQGAFILLF